MTPPGFGGPRPPVSPLPANGQTPIEPVPPMVAAETVTPDVAMYLTPRSVELKGQNILVVFNPAARDGRVGKELPLLQKTLEQSGARVIPVETLPDETARRARIVETAQAALAEGGRIFVLPYGGDGTIWETVGEVVRAAGVPFERPLVDFPIVQDLNSRVSFFLAKKGTASDNAVQVGAPSRIGAMPKYLRGAVELPFWFPTVEVNEQPGRVEVAGHNYGLGSSGFIFSKRIENLARRTEDLRANPNSLLNRGPIGYLRNFFNRGLLSYLRLLPSAIFNRYGLLGFDVQLKHYDGQGGMIREATMLGSEVITTSNRIMAGVGGVPGAWGETKVVVLPPFPGGVVPLGEYIFRGIATKLGLNFVGPRSSLRTLSADRQWRIKPGERIEVQARVPVSQPRSFLWRVLRLAHEENFSWRFFKPGPEVPLPGEPLSVPAQRNGDVVPASSGYTVRSPGVPISMLAHPNSLAVRLARASALINGNVPLISDAQVTSFLENHEPRVLQESQDSLEARTPFVSQPRLWRLMKHHGVSFEQSPDLLLASQHVVGVEQLRNMASSRVEIGKIQEFLQGHQGDVWMEAQQRAGTATRWLRGGLPMFSGIAAMFGAEQLADSLGLDPVKQRELRFGLVVYSSHFVNTNLAPVWEVAANRLLQRPYDFVRTRSVRAAGETFLQYTYERNSSVLQSLWSSWRSSASLEAGVSSLLMREGLTLLPKAMWSMGQGLMMSRIAEQVVSQLPHDSWAYRYGPSAAFFLPDFARLMSPSRAMGFFETRAMQWASRAFAVGFAGDMAFTGIYRLEHGDRAGYEQWVNHRSSEARMERDPGFLGWRYLPHVLAPSLADYWDSHDYLFGASNSERRRIEAEDREQSSLLRESIRSDLAWLPEVLHQPVGEIFRSEIALSDDEQRMLQQLNACRGGTLLPADAGFEETARYLRRQYRGVISSLDEAKGHLARIHASQVQQSLAYLHSVDLSENQVIRALFDENGRLLPDRQEALTTWIGPPSRDLSLASL